MLDGALDGNHSAKLEESRPIRRDRVTGDKVTDGMLQTLIVALTPFERPDAGLVRATARAGAIPVLDLGREASAGRRAVAQVARAVSRFGVRFPAGCPLGSADLPPEVDLVIAVDPAGAPLGEGRRLWVQVRSLEEARDAVAAGAEALIAKGNESGGRVAEETTYVLLQRLVQADLGVPVLAQGGIGPNTAAACVAGGAAGIVLDAQLGLAREVRLPRPLRALLGTLDGGDTVIRGGHRVFTRPGTFAASVDEEVAAEDVAALLGDDLQRHLLPMGQGAALAKPLAERWRGAGAIIHGFRRTIEANLAAAARAEALAPGAALAAAHGLTYPIAQGPMTRVSDRAAFAERVAEAGGLPFLALSMMRGAQVRELMAETAERLGDRPWGVGVLGFVPPALREEQLEVLRDIPPPVALIAGGRPSQARPLEDDGIATWLHVPSPGLLRLFLKEGARRFVFEGRECGGHVGPRSSFVLWEQQIDVLLAHAEDLSDVEVFFAGGIHDGRSAAMVAAMAAPLTERGAKIGVLMGTAYLFTEEAVASGAIKPGFHQAALGCEKTVLLETAPGHATRCVDSEYVRAFSAEKARLEAEGVDKKAMWETLEQLNLGRLRIASKGLRREGADLVDVDEAGQQREGMFMIGQVGSLRREATTIAALHESVSVGATARLARFNPADEAEEVASEPADVAIIGIACVFPDAPDLESFWRNILDGRNSIREVPPTRWKTETFYDPAATGEGAGVKTPSKWGGFLDDVAFDPLTYGIPPRSLAAIEPVQLLSLEVARRALADAGYAEGRPFARDKTSVIFGAEAGTDLSNAYGFRALFPQYVGPIPEALDAALPSLTEDSFPGVLANVIAGRIANRLDLGGVNYTVDAACAASLAALDLAVKELVTGTSEMVLCGGADLHNSINDYLLFASVHALSPDGQCKTFDSSANGIVLGEGAACLVLKRLADAERDGDRIYAVIKGVAGSSDGKSLGLTAPRKDGQKRALSRAYQRAGISPARVGLVEAHGTGTVVGDKTELGTLSEIWQEAGATPRAAVLGSVKSQIGHTKCVAGMAGLIKMALSVYHGVRPPTLHVKDPNPAWKADESPFVFYDRPQPWPERERLAGVSAFGFGGTNFHAVVAAADPDLRPATGAERWPAELFLFRGADRAAARARIEQLSSAIDTATAPLKLRDLAATVAGSRATGPVQVAVVAEGVAELRALLDKAASFTPTRGAVFVPGEAAAEPPGKVAFLCPGQGSQRPGMLADLFIAFPELQEVLTLGDAELIGTMYPPAAFDRAAKKAQAKALTDTRMAQPALGLVDLAMADLLASVGVRPDMLAGHSYGELAALCLAGSFSREALVAMSRARAEAILGAAGEDPGTMAAVQAPRATIEPLLADFPGVIVANHNAPEQAVISGPTASVEAAAAALEAADLSVRKIRVACAFHSPLVSGARDTLAAHLAGVAIAAPRVPVFANSRASAYPSEVASVAEILAEQVASPVRFVEQIEAMYEAGARVFVEAGPGRTLSGLVGKILGERPHAVVVCDDKDSHGLTQLLRALAELAILGVGVDEGGLFADRACEVVDLERPPQLAPTTWFVNGHTSRPMKGKAPKGALVPLAEPLGLSLGAGPAPPQGDERQAVVMNYLAGMQDLVNAQREVMLSYLGEVPRVAPRAAARQAPATVVDVAPEPRLEAPAPAAAGGRPNLLETLLDIVSERTGYPIEMLDVDLDLEADLSIDSIKRIEILGELGDRVGFGGAGDEEEVIEELAGIKTLRGIVEWLEERLDDAPAEPERVPAAATEAVPAEPADPESPAPEPEAAEGAVTRFTLEVEPGPPPGINGLSLDGRRFAITDDGRGIAEELRGMLEAQGADADIVNAATDFRAMGQLDGLVELAPVGSMAPPDVVKEVFERTRQVMTTGAHFAVACTRFGGRLGRDGNVPEDPSCRGIAGLMKTVAREYPEARVRVIDLDPNEDPTRLARHIRNELLTHDHHIEVGYKSGVRHTLKVMSNPLGSGGADALQLEAESVVLLTGGARGITARVAIALAQRFGCRLVLVGRSQLPSDPEPAEVAAAVDDAALRKAFVALGLKRPAEIESQVSRVRAARQIRATLSEIKEAGGTPEYRSVDVRDAGAFAALIDELYATHGRLDGVVHGAGVLEDRLIRDKDAASFARVYDTKVTAAAVLAEKLRDDVRFVVFFGSVSGAFGNRGQADYAAANDALDKLAWALDRRIEGRVVSVDWGPWGGTGMIGPELEREYARRGIPLIPVDEGVRSLLDELWLGKKGDAQVVWMAGDPREVWAGAAQHSGPVNA